MTDAVAQPELPAKPQRSALVIFLQSTLLLEALTVFFAALVTWSLARAGELDVSPLLAWGLGIGLAALFALASGRAGTKWARMLGWFLHIPLLLAGFVLPAIAVMGVVFLGVYALGFRLGSKIDRERAERAAAAEDVEQ